MEDFRRTPFNPKPYRGRIQTTLQGAPKTVQDTLHNQWLCRLQQTKCLVDCYSRLTSQRRNRHHSKTRQSGFLQSLVPGSKTRPPLEASNKPKLSQQIPGHNKVQDGDSRIHTGFSQKERMGHLYRPYRRLPPHIHSPSVTQVPPVLPQRRLLPVHQPPFRSRHSSFDLHQYSQGSQAFSLATGNTYSSIPRRLADPCPLQGGVPQTDPKVVKPNSGVGFPGEPQKIRTGTFSEVRFLGYHFLLDLGLIKPTQDR